MAYHRISHDVTAKIEKKWCNFIYIQTNNIWKRDKENMDLKSIFNMDGVMEAAQGVADQMMAATSEMMGSITSLF